MSNLSKILKSSKIEIIREIFSKNKIDTLIVFPYQKIAYYLIKDKERNKDDVRFWIISDREIKDVNDIIKNKVKVGVYLNDLYHAQIKQIRKKFRIIDISKEIDKKREVKTKDEIENIKKACKINERVYEKIISKRIFDINETDLAKEIEKGIIDYNARAAFPTIVSYGKNTSSIHHIPKKYIAKDIVMIDFGSQFNGYCSDITITIPRKNIYREVFEDVYYTLGILEDYAKEGMDVQELKKIAEDCLRKYKKGIFSRYHMLGHGVGIEIHESPNFNENEILKKNMIVALEPAVYFKGKFGIRLESTYLIRKEKKARNLCSIIEKIL